MTVLPLFPSEVDAATVDPEPRNRRFTPRVISEAPLSLHGRTRWDLDAAAEKGGTVARRFIGYDDDALSGPRWGDYLGADAGAPPLVWLNPPFLGGVKEAWIERALIESRRGLVVWMLLPLSADGFARTLDLHADALIDVTWRVKFSSPAGLRTDQPMQHRHRIWRLSPPGYSDDMTGKLYLLTEQGALHRPGAMRP